MKIKFRSCTNSFTFPSSKIIDHNARIVTRWYLSFNQQRSHECTNNFQFGIPQNLQVATWKTLNKFSSTIVSFKIHQQGHNTVYRCVCQLSLKNFLNHSRERGSRWSRFDGRTAKARMKTRRYFQQRWLSSSLFVDRARPSTPVAFDVPLFGHQVSYLPASVRR